MAIDNLNYLSSWLPAWQLTDKYSNLPWCLKSKNLDIFSSSKSVKATAFSAPTTTDADIIKQERNLILKTDWKVYEREDGVDTLVVDPSINFPVYQVCYTWENGTYAAAQWGTVQDMSARYEWDELKSFIVFTDRSSYVYSSEYFTIDKSWRNYVPSTWGFEKIDEVPFADGYWFRQYGESEYAEIFIDLWDAPFTSWKLKIKAEESTSGTADISIDRINIVWKPQGYYYDAQLDTMTYSWGSTQSISWSWNITEWILIDIPIYPRRATNYYLAMRFRFIRRQWSTGYEWKGNLYLDFNGWPSEDHRMTIDGVKSQWDYNEYYNYLPIRERKLVNIWEYGYSESYWIKWTTFQPLYKWVSSWIEANWEKKTRYDFITDMGWENDPSMDVIWLISWNEQVYMIGNLNWNWYIIPCDLSWGRWTPYIAYGCTFTWVANIDYLLYLVGENRWISNLWVYNWQELVSVIWGNKEKTYNDIIDLDEQYKFDWKIVNWRKNLILSTEDNRLFQYWQTYGGKGWSFIHQLPSNAVINSLKANWNDLEVEYSITESWTTTNYKIKYQDDTPIKNYNTEWEATYPIVIWNHLLEKEESDLYASYVIPNWACKLEFWGNANHYTYWSFKVTSNFTPPAWSLWDIQWLANGLVLVTTRLEFVEKNDEWLTFRLVWEMPVMSGNETWRIIYKTKNSDYYLDYTEVNHFRKIWEVTASQFEEWEFRFHNLNNKLELPKSHSLQIMVRGKGTANYTPELFSLDLVANQRDRW